MKLGVLYSPCLIRWSGDHVIPGELCDIFLAPFWQNWPHIWGGQKTTCASSLTKDMTFGSRALQSIGDCTSVSWQSCFQQELVSVISLMNQKGLKWSSVAHQHIKLTQHDEILLAGAQLPGASSYKHADTWEMKWHVHFGGDWHLPTCIQWMLKTMKWESVGECPVCWLVLAETPVLFLYLGRSNHRRFSAVASTALSSLTSPKLPLTPPNCLHHLSLLMAP